MGIWYVLLVMPACSANSHREGIAWRLSVSGVVLFSKVVMLGPLCCLLTGSESGQFYNKWWIVGGASYVAWAAREYHHGERYSGGRSGSCSSWRPFFREVEAFHLASISSVSAAPVLALWTSTCAPRGRPLGSGFSLLGILGFVLFALYLLESLSLVFRVNS